MIIVPECILEQKKQKMRAAASAGLRDNSPVLCARPVTASALSSEKQWMRMHLHLLYLGYLLETVSILQLQGEKSHFSSYLPTYPFSFHFVKDTLQNAVEQHIFSITIGSSRATSRGQVEVASKCTKILLDDSSFSLLNFP